MPDYVTHHDIEQMKEAICGRLDGHGKSLERIWEELKDIRKEKADNDEKVSDRFNVLAEKCMERHSGTTAKVVGISSFISGITTAIGWLFKHG